LHKRWLKLPSEYYKQFTTIKKHTLSYYSSLYAEPKHSEAGINNLICRYMHANEYNYKLTLDATLEYLKWEKQMAEDYSLNMFAHIHKIDVSFALCSSSPSWAMISREGQWCSIGLPT
jgi:hypothetical protein